MCDNSCAHHAINLQRWMTDLPLELKRLPIIYLAIPGSHDSMTYGITQKSGLAPDAKPVWSNLYPAFRGTILRWTVTQTLDTFGQLLCGIRYFDLRIATKTGTDDFYFTHGLYADEITQALTVVKEFVDTNPGEVVILDFQHFYGFTPDDHQRLVRFIVRLYGLRLVPRTMESVTLSNLTRLRHNVIVVYRQQAVYSTPEFWLPQMLSSPWPNQDSLKGLMRFLQNVTRSPGAGFVHQAVLTPTPTYILFRWTSSLKERCAKPVMREIVPQLVEFTPGQPNYYDPPERSPVNVVIADFIELEDAIFPNTIIRLNWKLLNDTDSGFQRG